MASDSIYHVLRDETDRLVRLGREKSLDGLTLGEIWTLFEQGVKSLIEVVESIPADPRERREALLVAAEDLYRQVIEPIDLPWVPDATIDPLLSAAIRPLLSWLIGRLSVRVYRQAQRAVE